MDAEELEDAGRHGERSQAHRFAAGRRQGELVGDDRRRTVRCGARGASKSRRSGSEAGSRNVPLSRSVSQTATRRSGCGIRHRLQEHGIDHAEDRRRRAEADREREDGRESESRAAPQESRRRSERPDRFRPNGEPRGAGPGGAGGRDRAGPSPAEPRRKAFAVAQLGAHVVARPRARRPRSRAVPRTAARDRRRAPRRSRRRARASPVSASSSSRTTARQSIGLMPRSGRRRDRARS